MVQEDILPIRENDYQQWVNTLKSRFQSAKVSASLKVNNELLRFYLSVGEDISNNQFDNRYGSQFYKRLSLDLQRAIPNTKGRFYKLACDVFTAIVPEVFVLHEGA